jgi:uncharacterized protein YaaN involved in tellurite resistance
MPKTRQLPEVRTRLRSEDLERLERICRAEDKTQAEVARRALLFYLDSHETEQLDRRESKLEARMRKMEDRLAAMIMRPTIDVGVIYQAIYHNYGKDAERAFMAFYNHALKRLQTKRKDTGDKASVMKLVDELYRKDEPKTMPEEKPEQAKSEELAADKPVLKRYSVDE